MQDTKNLLHHVFFWLKDPSSAQDRQKLIEGLRSLEQADTITGIHIGIPAATPKREVIDDTYDVSLLLTFKSVEDHDTYQAHPVHQHFVESCGQLWKHVRIYDTEKI